MLVRNNQPSFGMVRYGEGVSEYVSRLSHVRAVEFRVTAIKNKENPIGIDLSLVKRLGKDRLMATVGCKNFVENIFINPVCTLRRAISNANKIHAHQEYVQKATQGMSIPKVYG